MRTLHPRSTAVTAALVSLLSAGSAEAQSVSRFAFRAELGAGVMTPTVQRQTLGYDGAHFQLNGRFAFDLADWLALQVSVSNGFFLAADDRPLGRVLAFQGGLRLQPAAGTLGRVWADVNPGIFLTGDDQRFGLDAGLGFEFNLARSVALGPFARAHLVTSDPDIHQPSDAFYVSFGASLTLRLPGESSSGELRDRDSDGVADPDDLCGDVPQGARPDPNRSGCPMGDGDRDGVLDADDLCVAESQGDHPDPARRGCPVTDTDVDGVLDTEDLCVNEPPGALPDPTRRGCPAGDRDHDGVMDHEDMCPDESLQPFPDESRHGCSFRDTDHDLVPEPADACPETPGVPSPNAARNGCPNNLVQIDGSQIRIMQQVFFDTDRARIKRASDAVLSAVADVLRAAPQIRRIAVGGHTDNRATETYNVTLSQRRAEAVVRWLVADGIDASRLEAHGYGSSRPLVSNDDNSGRARNRRVEFVMLDMGPLTPTPDAPAAHGDAPAAHGEAPAAHGDAPAAHGEAPAAHGEAPAAHGDAPAAHGEAPAAHGDAPAAHGDAPAAHGEAPAAHGDAPATHGHAPAAHGEAPAAHGDAPATHGHAPAAHGHAPASRGDAPAAHGDAPAAHGHAPASRGDAPAAHGDAPAAHGDAPAAHGDAPAAHGDAPAAHGDAPAGTEGHSSGHHRRRH